MYSILRIYFEVALNSMGDGPMGDGMAAVKEAAVIGISSMMFVHFLLSVFCLSSLRGVRSCDGRHGLGSRLGLPGLFVFNLLFLASI